MSKCICFQLQVNEQTYISIPIERQREDTFVAVSDIVSLLEKDGKLHVFSSGLCQCLINFSCKNTFLQLDM